MARRPGEIIYGVYIERNGAGPRVTSENRRWQAEIEQILTAQLPEDLDRFFGIQANVQIKGVRYGSLEIFFGVVLAAYSIFSGYKGLLDSVELVQKQARKLIYPIVNPTGSYDYVVNVDVLYPHLSSRDDIEALVRLLSDARSGPGLVRIPGLLGLLHGGSRPRSGHELDEYLAATNSPTLDVSAPSRAKGNSGFFYFLLFMVFFQLVVIVALVSMAVVRTYFTMP